MEIFLMVLLGFLVFINILKKTEVRILILIFNLMNSLGLILYSLGLEYYKVPTFESRIIMYILLIIFNVAYIFYSLTPEIKFRDNDNLVQRNYFNLIYLVIFIFPLILYFVHFHKHFSIYYMVNGISVSESIRPDVSGTLPRYYTFSVYLTCFTLPYLIGALKKSTLIKNKVFFSLMILFFWLLIGNKSTILTIVFFFFFYGEKKIEIKRVFQFVLLFLVVYIGMKFLYYQEFRFDGIRGVFESIFRRVSMINISVMGEYIQYFIIDGLEIPENFRHLKQFLFYRIYNRMVGGAPTNFMASLLSFFKFGYIQSILYFCIFYLIFISLSIVRKVRLFNEVLDIAKDYLFFYGLILLSNGFLKDYLIRIIIPMMIFYIFSKVEFTFYKRRTIGNTSNDSNSSL